MNKDASSSKPATQVVSKYFTDGQPSMDESLTDFKEPKKNFSGPKNTTKPVKSKPKAKPKKKIKGQKDIRSVLKSKNELVEYTEDFNKICANAGIDVDSEQLQLAIALSKSLQETATEETNNTETLTSKKRTGEIRKTLQQYGFKVPENVGVRKGKKRQRKCERDSKLLKTSEDEKRQNIADKYAEILFNSLIKVAQVSHTEGNTQSALFDLASKPYNGMKDVNIFTVGLVEVSTCYTGSLFKDWSAIPGRPLSPVSEKPHSSNIVDLDFTETEINVLLSGSIKQTQNTVLEKISLTNMDKFIGDNTCTEDMKGSEENTPNKLNSKDTYTTENKLRNYSEIAYYTSNEYDTNTKDMKDTGEITYMNKKEINTNVNNASNNCETVSRCDSPDLFDDDLSVTESSKCITEVQSASFGRNYSMTLKENTSNVHEIIVDEDNDTNKCEDIMDLTDEYDPCGLKDNDTVSDSIITKDFVVATSVKIIDETVNLTDQEDAQFSYVEENHRDSCVIEITDGVEKIISDGIPNREIENIDLTQKYDGYNDDTIILDQNETIDDKDSSKVEFDLTQSSDSLPSIHLSGTEAKDVIDLEEPIETNQIDDINKTNVKERESASSKTSDVFEEYIYEHSHSSNDKTVAEDRITDLTQSTPDNSEFNENAIRNGEQSYNEEFVDPGVLPDYDYQFGGNDDTIIYNENTASSSVKESLEKLSQDEVFEISDEELNYSVHKSKVNFDISQESVETQGNFDLGGVSVLDNDSFLPEVNVKEPKVKSPVKVKLPVIGKTPNKNCKESVIQTPKNDYIVKLDQVTPMADYASMSTPERNTELDKYGLKPLKRKRAIQLLTHLYNQTHPLVDEESPSKKRKSITSTSPIKNLSHKKISSSEEIKTVNKENSNNEEISQETLKEIVVKDIGDCDPDDWVFQKREKAKVHTCRLPLHIAFHNYVSSKTELREAILRYEPINIEVIHKDLVTYGHRYHPKDLLKFLDKKCITVKTAESNANTKKSQKES